MILMIKMIKMIMDQYVKNAKNNYKVFVYLVINLHVIIVDHQYQKDNIYCLVDHAILICVMIVKVRNSLSLKRKNKNNNLIIIIIIS